MKFLLLFLLLLLNNCLAASGSKQNENHKRKIDQVLAEDDRNGNASKKAKISNDSESDYSNFDNCTDIGSAISQITQDAIKKNNKVILKIFESSNLKSSLEQCENIKDAETQATISKIIISKYLKYLKDVFKDGLSSYISGAKFEISKRLEFKDLNSDQIFRIKSNSDVTWAIIQDIDDKVIVTEFEKDKIIYETDTSGFPDLSRDSKYLLISNHDDESLILLDTKKDFQESKDKKFKLKEISNSNADNEEYYPDTLCFSPCDKYVAGLWIDESNAQRKVISGIWNLNSGKRICNWFKPKAEECDYIAFSPNGKYLISALCERGQKIAISPDSKHIALVAKKDEASIWNKKDKSSIVLYDENFSAAQNPDTIVSIWDVNSKAFTKKINFLKKILAIRFSKYNCFLIISCIDLNDNERFNTFFYNLLTDTVVNSFIDKEFTLLDLNNIGNKMVMSIGYKNILQICDFSNSWIINNLSLKQLIFVTKLILNPIDDSLSWRELVDNFKSLPIQTVIELIQFVLPKLILEYTKIEGKNVDLTKIISQYVGLPDDLKDDKALVETIYNNVAA